MIRLEGDEEVIFDHYRDDQIDRLDRSAVVGNLVESGLWTAIRTRPFDRIPSPCSLMPNKAGSSGGDDRETDTLPLVNRFGHGSARVSCEDTGVCTGCGGVDSSVDSGRSVPGSASSSSMPTALFITAIDTRPLAADPEVVIGQQVGLFYDGLRVLGRLGIDKNYLCAAPGAQIPGAGLDHIERVDFAGPHPAGLVGTHINKLAPVGRNRTVWHIGYQDVIAIGQLFRTGQLDTRRVVALAGPGVLRPALVQDLFGR